MSGDRHALGAVAVGRGREAVKAQQILGDRAKLAPPRGLRKRCVGGWHHRAGQEHQRHPQEHGRGEEVPKSGAKAS